MGESSIQVTIVNDNRRVECDAECGIDWSSPGAVALASQRVRERFGNEVKLEYVELSGAGDDGEAGKWNQVASDKNLALPLLLVNGQVRISGNFDIRQLLDVIEVETELGV